MEQWKWAEKTYIWFWVRWLAEHTPNSGKYRFTKFGRLTGRHLMEGAKIILFICLLNLFWFAVNPSTYLHKETGVIKAK